MKKELPRDLKEALIESFASLELQECCRRNKSFQIDTYKDKSSNEIIEKHRRSQTVKAKIENYIKK